MSRSREKEASGEEGYSIDYPYGSFLYVHLRISEAKGDLKPFSDQRKHLFFP